jgi:uncharacterized protein YciI
MPTFVVRSNISPHFREAHFKTLKVDSKLSGDIAAHVVAHVEYHRALKAKGKILCGKPMVDFTWGLAVLKVDSLEEAKTFIENDPTIKHGLFLDYEIIPWYHIV